MYRKVEIIGVPRCGTTVLYQIVKEIIQLRGLHYIKPNRNHGIRRKEKGCLYVFLIRNLVDALYSQAFSDTKGRNRDLNLTKNELIKKALEDNFFFSCIDNVYSHFSVADKEPDFFILKYKDYLPGNIRLLIKDVSERIFKSINIGELTQDEIEQIVEKTDIHKNYEIAKRFDDFGSWDNTSGIHGDHITNMGKTHDWFSDVEEDTIQILKEKMNPILKKYGYQEI